MHECSKTQVITYLSIGIKRMVYITLA